MEALCPPVRTRHRVRCDRGYVLRRAFSLTWPYPSMTSLDANAFRLDGKPGNGTGAAKLCGERQLRLEALNG